MEDEAGRSKTRSSRRTGLQVTTVGYGAMELRGPPRARDITEAQAETILNANPRRAGALRGRGDPHGRRQPLRSRRLHLDLTISAAGCARRSDRIGLGPGEARLGQASRHSYGGYKQSGIGREFSLEGMLESFTQRQKS